MSPLNHLAAIEPSSPGRTSGAIAKFRLAKINVHVTDMDAFRSPEAAKIRADFFGTHKPASTLVQVVRLASPDYKVEIEAIAVLP